MDQADRNRAMAEHVFTRNVLTDLMVAQCMESTDPIAAVDERSKYKLAAADMQLAKRVDALSHLVLQETETFWEGVRVEVEARVRFREAHARSEG